MLAKRFRPLSRMLSRAYGPVDWVQRLWNGLFTFPLASAQIVLAISGQNQKGHTLPCRVIQRSVFRWCAEFEVPRWCVYNSSTPYTNVRWRQANSCRRSDANLQRLLIVSSNGARSSTSLPVCWQKKLTFVTKFLNCFSHANKDMRCCLAIGVSRSVALAWKFIKSGC